MRLTLFLADKIAEFQLPKEISGSYRFDDNTEEENKLINIEARDNKWILYETDDVKIIRDNTFVENIELIENNFYLVKRNEQVYLFQTTRTYEEGFTSYLYNEKTYLIISDDKDSNITYRCPYLNGLIVEVAIVDGKLVMRNNQKMMVYHNDKRVETTDVKINVGDCINILGLKILFLANIIIINNPNNLATINAVNANLSLFNVEIDNYQNVEVKDKDLYNKNDYFSKSPRIRRIIEEKKIDMTVAPEVNKKDEMPLALTIGPMLSMGAMSAMNVLNLITQINAGKTTLQASWMQLVSALLMLGSSMLWPLLTKAYNKHIERDNKRALYKKYGEYLNEKAAELEKERIYQKSILEENLLKYTDCLKIINTRKNNFWSKRIEQNDFLMVRVGIGRVPLKVQIDFKREDFTLDKSDLKKRAEELIDSYKYIEDVPVGYSFSENFLTAITGLKQKSQGFINNILLQLMTFYCYDELKIIVFTNAENEKQWEYIKYSNYCFDNQKEIRYFVSDYEESKELSEILNFELNNRLQLLSKKQQVTKPHYLVITDNYPAIKKLDFFKNLTELNVNIGYSAIIMEKTLSKLPSKCSNFINLAEGRSNILKNSYENQEIIEFIDESNYEVNMKAVTQILSNVPVEIEGATSQLPDSIAFMEMEKAGKVEQLNILNRWKTNDSTKSLKAEIGVDEDYNYMYLDLHEKAHGPHGLIAGMTGSGKSEFIITYILSMAMNYSPDDVAFILIDYKGGGLAFAFENKLTGVKLPHLAGTITNLDKAEMNRTLVSIDSEVKRRQNEFNKARDLLGESTIDIYKYQKFYHEGQLTTPIPHLFIISDEFAELKSQQPEFMDNLISVARIGRSLGVHLILATQKPSGVVNDQIWSNSKFRVCLKVQDESDSKEMLKRPEAASLKQTGRFYLQVGYDEYFALGQSAWAGAKYFPSERIAKVVDKSVNFINNRGLIIKSIQADNGKAKSEAQGEQLAAVLNEIIKVSEQVNKKAKKLWLDNIPPLILIDDIEKKYKLTHQPYNIIATIGEYDAPELQEQGIVTYDILNDGNTIIYGTDGGERESLINAIIYSVTKHHTPEEINFYTLDYGSESLRIFAKLPHFGGMVFAGEQEKYTNLIKMIKNEMKKRKKLFVEYGGSYSNYIKNSGKTLPIKVYIINNYDSISETVKEFYDDFPEIIRDSDRYGLVFIVTANGTGSLGNRISQNFDNSYALKLKDSYDYNTVFDAKIKNPPQEVEGRGMFKKESVHEFQTASIITEKANVGNYITKWSDEIKKQTASIAEKIPALPDVVTLEEVEKDIKDFTSLPVGIERHNLNVYKYNFLSAIGTIITSNKIENTKSFVKSLIDIIAKQKNSGCILIDAVNQLEEAKSKVSNYFNQNFDSVVEKLLGYMDTCLSQAQEKTSMVIIYGLDKMLSNMNAKEKYDELIKKIKKYEKNPIIIIDDVNKIKTYQYEEWFGGMFNTGEGIWIGKGLGDQNLLKTNTYNKEYTLEYKNDMGFIVTEGSGTLCKYIDFYNEGVEKDE